MAAKTELRKKLKLELSKLSPEQMRKRSTLACDLLIEQPEFSNAEIILVFLSLPSEINTASLVLRAWQERKRVLAPRVSWAQRRMIAVEIRSLSEQEFEVTEFHIRQPTQGSPFPLSLVDLVIVPGLGFDPSGSRLGRGRGFYDRFLADPEFDGVTCALAFEEQIVQEIPHAPHDIKVDMLVTDRKVHRFSALHHRHAAK